MTEQASRFCVLDASNYEDLRRWTRMWESWPNREVFAHPHYVRLFADSTSRPLCAAWDSEQGRVLYPFLLRQIDPECCRCEGQPPMTDICSPYGYGGAFFWGSSDPQSLASDFWRCYDGWARQSGVVSEFARFALFDESILDYPGQKLMKQDNVVRSLDVDEDDLWRDFHPKVRKNVNCARRSGVEIEFDPLGCKLVEFQRVYLATMARRSADAVYSFSPVFFDTIRHDLPGQFAYFHAIHDGQVVSTELVLVSAENVYSFLGGTDADCFELRPNDLLKYEITLWAKSQGKRRYVIGGGYQPSDGVFQFKRAFAPDGCVPFHVGRRVFRSDLYAQLVRRRASAQRALGRQWRPRSGYFPAYRT